MFDSIPSDYTRGFISGVIATLSGFILTIIWDSIKYIRDRKKKDNAVLTTLRHEINGNLEILRKIKKLAKGEIEILKNKRSYITPFPPLHESMWRIIALNMPKKFIEDPELLDAFRITTQETMQFIEILNSREEYRLNNEAMDNYEKRMQSYDETILDDSHHLIENLEILIQHV